jgi:4-amino-4-deoxy-L-arabinose transferase-like glycosyltransferase
LNRENYLIAFTLFLLVLSAFAIRFNNYLQTQKYSIDEVVYYQLARNLLKTPPQYNVIEYGHELSATQPEVGLLPEYFKQPLFKYPPLFPLLVSLSLRIFGDTIASAAIIPAFMGVMLIPVVFFLGKVFFDEITGLLAAFALWMDPVNIICSQKVWMDTTLSFFTLLSILLFAIAGKSRKNHFFLFSGFAAGLAVMTKYPGILATFIIFLYALIQNRDYFKNAFFKWSLGTPFLMLGPWLYWNWHVYGINIVRQLTTIHGMISSRSNAHLLLLGIVLLICIIAAFILKKRRKEAPSWTEDEAESEDPEILAASPASIIRKILVWAMILVFLINLWPHVQRSLLFKSFPVTSWQPGRFRSPLFYFGQPIEFSLIYAIAFLSFFVYNEKRVNDSVLLLVTVAVIYVFFLLWGGFQMRYILAGLPVLIIYGVQFMRETAAFLSRQRYIFKIIGLSLFFSAAVYIFIKTSYVNYLISYPNDMCYF